MAQGQSHTADDAAPMRVMVQLARWGAIVGACAALLFSFYPQTDIAVAHLLYVQDGRFVGHDNAIVSLLRNGLLGLYVLACVVAIIGLVLPYSRRWLRLDATRWIFIGLCLAIGPGLVANVMFKDHWGRARPKQVLEFGGLKPFTPPLQPARNCDRNCSFVSGEASSMFALFFAAAAVLRRRSHILIGVGVGVGLLAGGLRMAQGAHFLSDIVFAGVFMAVTIATVAVAFELRHAGGYDRVRFALLGASAR